MPDDATLYDLMLLLSSTATEERRKKILDDVQGAISSGDGAVRRSDDWGMRPMAYQIAHQREAEYHLIQFTGPSALLETLDHTLRITDGVTRFRIIRVLPGTPPAPASSPPVVAAARSAPVAPPPEEPEEQAS